MDSNKILAYDASTGKRFTEGEIAQGSFDAPDDVWKDETDDVPQQPESNQQLDELSQMVTSLTQQNTALLERCQELDAQYIECLCTLLLLAKIQGVEIGRLEVVNPNTNRISDAVGAIAMRFAGRFFCYRLPATWASAISKSITMPSFGQVTETYLGNVKNAESLNYLQAMQPAGIVSGGSKAIPVNQIDELIGILQLAHAPKVSVSIDDDTEEIKRHAAVESNRYILKALEMLQ